MTVFENFKSKNIDELVEWLKKYGVQDFSPWDNWFYKNYCRKCHPITKENTNCHFCKTLEYAWCELNDSKCKFFPDMKEAPYGEQVIKMWLESEDNDGV